MAIAGPQARMKAGADPPGQVGGDAGTSFTQKEPLAQPPGWEELGFGGEGLLGHSKRHTGQS